MDAVELGLFVVFPVELVCVWVVCVVPLTVDAVLETLYVVMLAVVVVMEIFVDVVFSEVTLLVVLETFGESVEFVVWLELCTVVVLLVELLDV